MSRVQCDCVCFRDICTVEYGMPLVMGSGENSVAACLGLQNDDGKDGK